MECLETGKLNRSVLCGTISCVWLSERIRHIQKFLREENWYVFNKESDIDVNLFLLATTRSYKGEIIQNVCCRIKIIQTRIYFILYKLICCQ